MPNPRKWPRITVYGTRWCSDCARATRFLDHHGVPYDYADVEAENLEDHVIALNEKVGHGPRRRVPTLLIDEEIFSVPTNADLAQRLGL
jgi:mycoredoxin